MLEEILKSINSNLERIAKAQEDTIAYMREPITINEADVKKAMEVFENVEVRKVTEPLTQQPNTTAVPQTQTQMPQLVQNPESVQASQPTSIPTTQVQNSFTQEQLAVAMSNAVSAGKMDIIQNILQQFGVQALTQINPADYNKLATMLKEAGVNV